MKHLKKFFESIDFTKEEILENFIFISDRFGEPSVSITNYGNSKKWSISWDIKLDLSVLQEASELIKRLKDLVEDIDDVLSAADRLVEFNINMSLSDKLTIELVPKDTGDDNFKFIKGYESRALYVRINEVERFFNSKGIRIEKWDNESSYDELNQINNLEITLSKRDMESMNQFYWLIMAELNLIDDRDYQVRVEGGRKMVIYPDDEKAFIEVTTN